MRDKKQETDRKSSRTYQIDRTGRGGEKGSLYRESRGGASSYAGTRVRCTGVYWYVTVISTGCDGDGAGDGASAVRVQ